jgi:hypothetical protein
MDPLEGYAYRGLIFTFLLGAVSIVLARSYAYWSEQSAWHSRIGGILLLAFAVNRVWATYGPVSGLKSLLTVALCTTALILQDFWVERAEEALRRQREQEIRAGDR